MSSTLSRSPGGSAPSEPPFFLGTHLVASSLGSRFAITNSSSNTLYVCPSKHIWRSFRVEDLVFDLPRATWSSEFALVIYEDATGDGSALRMLDDYAFPWKFTLASSSERLRLGDDDTLGKHVFPPGRYSIGVWINSSSVRLWEVSSEADPWTQFGGLRVDTIPKTTSTPLATKRPCLKIALTLKPVPVEVSLSAESIGVMDKTKCLKQFTFRLDSTCFTLPSSSAVLSSSPFFTDAYAFSLSRESFGNSKEAMSQLRTILSSDGECLLRVLFGEEPSSFLSLFAFYALFRELGLVSHAYAICQLLRSVESLSQLFSLDL